MVYTKTLIKKAYVAFNERDVEGALALMSDDVSWPKASEGGKVIGKNEIRAYWARQCSVFDPHVEPREIVAVGGGKTEVRVHQIVRSLEGDILSDSESDTSSPSKVTASRAWNSRMRLAPLPVHLLPLRNIRPE